MATVIDNPTARQSAIQWSMDDMVKLLRDILGRFSKSDANNRQLSDKSINRLMDGASLKQLKRKMGLPEHYQPGQPLSTQGYEVTPMISHDLEPFKRYKGWDDEPALTVGTDGFILLPDDYFYYSSMTHTVDGVKKHFEFMPDEEFEKRVGDPLIAPNERNPVANLQFGHIRIAPITIQEVSMTYIKRPDKPVYATKTTNGYREYDETNSVELEWDDVNRLDIIYIMLYDLGINMQRGDLVQYAQKYQQQGI